MLKEDHSRYVKPILTRGVAVGHGVLQLVRRHCAHRAVGAARDGEPVVRDRRVRARGVTEATRRVVAPAAGHGFRQGVKAATEKKARQGPSFSSVLYGDAQHAGWRCWFSGLGVSQVWGFLFHMH